jgi:small conductance mechanosensitive channel
MQLEQARLIEIALRIGAALLVFLIGRWLAGRVRKMLNGTLAKTTIAPSMTRLIVLAAFYSVMLVTVIIALALLGFPIEALLTGSLVIVVILGLALQSSISNLAATIMFMLFQPFKLGELIDGNGVMGVVKEIQFFSTVLVTGDNKEITVPNAEIQGNNPINYTRLGRLRVDFVFSVGYSDQLDKVKRCWLRSSLPTRACSLSRRPSSLCSHSMHQAWASRCGPGSRPTITSHSSGTW